MGWHWFFTVIFALAGVAQTAKLVNSKEIFDRIFYLISATAYFILSNIHLIKIVLSFA